MSRTIRAETVIPHDPEHTWELMFANRLQHVVERSRALVAVEDYEMRADGTPRYVMVHRLGPFTTRFTSDYSCYDRPRRTVNTVEDSPFGGTYEITLEPEGMGTRVVHQWRIEGTNWFTRALLPAITPLMARSLQTDLDAFAKQEHGSGREDGPRP
ncbi:SRPBCC family protein [Kribbella sp. CA-253562]|uniref:SRPBCC family protein n=1 Tax=Kribbella sp. CA-253562 TaxID=3239942 RepID=UPI003D92EF18